MNSVVLFDSNQNDLEYNDRIILWNWRGEEFQLDTWNQGTRFTEFLTEAEVAEMFPITYVTRHLWENEVE